MGSIWPSQNAQPFGAKLNGKILISATKGSAMTLLSFSLVLRRENSLKRDAEIQYQIRLHVLVGLTATHRTYCLRRHRTETYSTTGTVGCVTVIGPIVVRGRTHSSVCRRTYDRVVGGKIVHVLRQLA